MTDEEKRSDEAEEAKNSGESETEEAKSEETKSEDRRAEEKDEPEIAASESDSDEVAPAAEEKTPEEPNIAAATDHDHDSDHGHDDHDEHLGHTAPVSLLVGVLVALGMLTILTVAVTAVDLGSQGNFVVAMIIATVKAVLVMGYFMHMFWDAKFNVVAFTSSFLFVLLFLAMAVLDGSEYQDTVQKYENDKKAQM